MRGATRTVYTVYDTDEDAVRVMEFTPVGKIQSKKGGIASYRLPVPPVMGGGGVLSGAASITPARGGWATSSLSVPGGRLSSRSLAASVSTGALATPAERGGIVSAAIARVYVIQQSDLSIALLGARQSEVMLLDGEGELAYVVRYDGSVWRPHDSRARENALSYTCVPRHETSGATKPPVTSTTSGSVALTEEEERMLGLGGALSPTAPACHMVAHSVEERYMALVYSDGLLQLMDTSSKLIFARVWLPTKKLGTVVQLYAMRDCVVTVVRLTDSDATQILSYELRPRVLLDSANVLM